MAISAGAIAATTTGTALLAGLLPSRPDLLLALSPGNAILLLVAHRMSFATYYSIGLSRLVLSDIAPYLLGYWHGRRGVELVVRNDRHRDLIDRQTAGLRPAALVALFLSASAVVSAMAGLARVRPLLFVVLDLVGTTVRLFLMWWLAGVFSAQLDAVSELIEDWQRYLLLAGVSGVGVATWWRYRRRGRDGDPATPNAEL